MAGSGHPARREFWTWFNDEWRGVYLTEGGHVTLHVSDKTDEGWSSCTEVYTFPEGADRIGCTVYTDGCDCDGRLATTWHGAALLTELGAYEPPANGDGSASPLTPKWSSILKVTQRDYQAEAAGY